MKLFKLVVLLVLLSVSTSFAWTNTLFDFRTSGACVSLPDCVVVTPTTMYPSTATVSSGTVTFGWEDSTNEWFRVELTSTIPTCKITAIGSKYIEFWDLAFSGSIDKIDHQGGGLFRYESTHVYSSQISRLHYPATIEAGVLAALYNC